MCNEKLTIGVLPLYVELYDKTNPARRARIEPFYENVAKALETRGFNVLRSPVCRLKNEFHDAVKSFEQGGASCIVTLHLAYSPSLESADVLASTDLPLVVLDTTETYEFGFYQDAAEIGPNHGIHGVMDMCNLLKKKGKKFSIVAGHWTESPVIDRCCDMVRASIAASALNGMKVGSIGGSFAGMGDFVISDAEMKSRFGVEVVYSDEKTLAAYAEAVTDAEIEAEIAYDYSIAEADKNIAHEVHARSERACLAVRHWLAEKNLGAFTANFLKIGENSGLTAMPFMEACKAMARGLGYAGEGDVLTAAFCGALRQGFVDTTFVEIFCPDWKDGRVLLSHMGEMNYACVNGKLELTEMSFPYNAENPVVAYGAYRGGEAIFANIFDDGNGYRLLLAPVTMDEAPADDTFGGKVRGWLRPAVSLEAFLEGISAAGATHHSIMVYDASLESMKQFAALLDLPVEVLA